MSRGLMGRGSPVGRIAHELAASRAGGGSRPPRHRRNRRRLARRRCRARRPCRTGSSDRKPVLLFEPERIAARLVLFDLVEQVVRKRQQLRHGAEALGNRPTGIAIGPQLVDEVAGLVHHGDVGVAEAVDRLLPVADEENRRDQRRAVGNAAALAPRSDQQRHERPLRPARVLKFVEQHVVISSFQAIAAARELVHLRQQRQRLRQRLGKIEDAMRIERVAVLPERDLVNAADASREHGIQIAPERLQRLGDVSTDGEHVGAVDPPGLGGLAVFRGVAVEPLPRLLVLVEEVSFDPIEHAARKPGRGHRTARRSAACRPRRSPSADDESAHSRGILRRRR